MYSGRARSWALMFRRRERAQESRVKLANWRLHREVIKMRCVSVRQLDLNCTLQMTKECLVILVFQFPVPSWSQFLFCLGTAGAKIAFTWCCGVCQFLQSISPIYSVLSTATIHVLKNNSVGQKLLSICRYLGFYRGCSCDCLESLRKIAIVGFRHFQNHSCGRGNKFQRNVFIEIMELDCIPVLKVLGWS